MLGIESKTMKKQQKHCVTKRRRRKKTYLTNQDTGHKTQANAGKDFPSILGAILKDIVTNQSGKANDQKAAREHALVQRPH
jgi:hypothetical protein